MSLPEPAEFRHALIKEYMRELHNGSYVGVPLIEICSGLMDIGTELYAEDQHLLTTDTFFTFLRSYITICGAITKRLSDMPQPLAAMRSWDEFRKETRITSPFTVALEHFISPANLVYWTRSAFKSFSSSTRLSLEANVERISRKELSPTAYESGQRVYPQDYKGDQLDYLRGTVLPKLLSVRFPYRLWDEQRRAHTMMVAGSGRGKTQTLEAMICDDLHRPDPPGVVVIDSKGDMFGRLSQLAVFDPDNGRLKDRVILIDPRDSPALNPFHITFNTDSEDTFAAVLSQLSYFFEALFGAELTGPMRAVLNPLAELMVRIPGANLMTLLDALDDPQQFEKHFPKLSPFSARYLTKDYKPKAHGPTIGALKGRISALVTQAPAFGRMFNANHNSLNIAQALNEGHIVLVSTEEGYLHDASPVFARYIIGMTAAAALSRSNIQKEEDRRQAYLFLDESAAYFDSRTPRLFNTLRSYGLGVMAAFHNFAQVGTELHATMMSSTSIKFAAGGSHADASVLYREMNLEDPSFIFRQGFNPRGYTDWACHVRNRTPIPVSLRATHGQLDRRPRMSEARYQIFREKNLERLSAPSKPPEPPRLGGPVVPSGELPTTPQPF